MKLTPKQKLFCELYALGGNATQAALEAGYSMSTAKEIGSENLTKPHLSEYIESLFNPGRDERIASIKERNEVLTSVMRNTENDEGISTADRLRAIDLLNKASGAYTNKHELTGKGGQDIGGATVINFIPVGR